VTKRGPQYRQALSHLYLSKHYPKRISVARGKGKTSSDPPRRDAFRIRRQIRKEFALAYEKVPDVRVTRKGYAIRASGQAVRSTLVTEQSKREIARICRGVKVALPETGARTW
jgi:hypothetical protein